MRNLTKIEAYQECLKATQNELAAKILVDKYFLCNQETYHESQPAHMWDRLATAIVKAEKPSEQGHWRTKFREVLEDFKFVPAGRVLYGLGNPYVSVTLKNCYAISIREDSIKGIFQTAYEMAETYKSGGGTGVDVSTLRPKGSPIKNAARESSGIAPFMDFYSHITGMIGQKARIGALMLCIDVSHPDIEDFISIKGGEDLNLVRYANISVKITDEFMHAVTDNLNFDLKWGGKVYRTIKARELWQKIIHYAWKRAEPGLLFWDTTCSEVPAHNYKNFACVATNPCSEASLSDGDSCNLGSINLSKYVRNPYEEKAEFDYATFDQDVRLGVRFLDNIITLEKSPMEFQQRANDEGRRLGLGIMGMADMFIKMRVRFDSEAALQLADKVMDRFMYSSYDASCELAREKGPFPVFDVQTHLKSRFIKRLPEDLQQKIKKTGIRNIAVHAIAPTGSLACIAKCSPAIEPVFKMQYIRKTNLGTAKETSEHTVLHPTAAEYIEKYKVDINSLPDFFVSAHQIASDFRIRLQSIAQKRIDQAISSTINLPGEATEEDVAKCYMEAWRQGCKGITVYRDGSREGVLVDVGKAEAMPTEIQVHSAPKRPESLEAIAHIIKPNGKRFTVFVGFLKGRIYEVFALDHAQAGVSDGMRGVILKCKDKDGNYYNFESGCLTVRKLNRYEDDASSLITRLISLGLRHGVSLGIVVNQISKSRIEVTNFARAVARALSIYINQDEVKGKFKCNKCGSKNIQFGGTCWTCLDCGQSVCF